MNWPPVKAWTSKCHIDGNLHFVAINYGGKLLDRWVVLMSVLDSSIVVKVSWSQLVDPSKWKCGWDETVYLNSTEIVNNNREEITNISRYPSNDSGLTIPITKNNIRSWFGDI